METAVDEAERQRRAAFPLEEEITRVYGLEPAAWITALLSDSSIASAEAPSPFPSPQGRQSRNGRGRPAAIIAPNPAGRKQAANLESIGYGPIPTFLESINLSPGCL